MADKIRVKPLREGVVMPELGLQYRMPSDGAEVEPTAYYFKLIKMGDIEVINEKSKSKRHAKPKLEGNVDERNDEITSAAPESETTE